MSNNIEKINYSSLKQIVEIANGENKTFAQVVIENQMLANSIDYITIMSKMRENYDVMTASINKGLKDKTKLKIEQNDGAKIYHNYVNNQKSLMGSKLGKIAARAMAVSEVNASMGKICASPTAGSCGIMPASIISIEEYDGINKNKTVEALFVSAGIGMVISNVMGVAGATGGCQAECGAATAMAAGAIVYMKDGTNEDILNAVAIALKNIEGLVCDPVASLVECPCIKRNASCAVSAVLAADMALAGIKSIIPADEVIYSCKQVGNLMSRELKETSLAGLAATETGKNLFNVFLNKL